MRHLTLSCLLLAAALAGCGSGAEAPPPERDPDERARLPPAQNDSHGTFADPLLEARDRAGERATEAVESRKGELDAAIAEDEGAAPSD